MRPQEDSPSEGAFFLAKMGEFGWIWLNGVKFLSSMPKKYVI